MSQSSGEAFISEVIADHLRSHTDIEFDRIPCPPEFKDYEEKDLPEKLSLILVDKNGHIVGRLHVKVDFHVMEADVGRYVQADVKNFSVCEFIYAKTAEGQIICPYCDQPIIQLNQDLETRRRWRWDKELKQYTERDPSDSCSKITCFNCGEELEYEIEDILGEHLRREEECQIKK